MLIVLFIFGMNLIQTIPGISPYQQSVVHQGRIERMFLDKISEWSTPPANNSEGSQCAVPVPLMKVERAVCPEMLTLPPTTASALSDLPEDRITVRLRHLSQAEAQPAQFSPMAPDGIFRSNMFQDDALDVNPVGLPSEERIEEVRCRFVIGADGARSWTRQAIGYKLVGESDDFFWGVLDGIPITNL
jgi:phenol 2-monooxygenase